MRGSPPSSGGIMRVTGATEGFHRNRGNRGSNNQPSQRSQSVGTATTTTRGRSGNDKSATTSPSSTQDAVRSESMDRLPSRTSLLNLSSSGLHMPPEVLGQVESPAEQGAIEQTPSSLRRSSALRNVNTKARKRSNQAIRATQSPAAAAAAVQVAKSHEFVNCLQSSSMFTLVTYKGVEILFSTTASGEILGVCSRTHMTLQTLRLASKAPVVSLSSNSITGMLVVVHQDGVVKTYQPLPTDPVELDHLHLLRTKALPKSTFGRYRWIDCRTIRAGELFYQPGEVVHFGDRRTSKPGELVDVALANDHKLLIAHRKQLALFEVVPKKQSADDTMTMNKEGSELHQHQHDSGDGTLSWTTVLPSNIRKAKISGDGQALVVVLEKTDDSNEETKHGVLTFIHDGHDGSKSSAVPRLLKSTDSIGTVYKPGPFLHHASPVTRISFRGLGHVTSSVTDDEQGNDLLLTCCDEDCSVKVFNQSTWTRLMAWTSPPNTRIDWVRGSAAFSLGDLESHKKGKNTSRVASRRPSGESSSDMSSAAAINDGLRNATPVAQGTPSSAAGAWISEVTFRGPFPAVKLSRISYMKRGSDSQPAHFESISAILPAGSVVAGSVLCSDDMGLSVQGVWPAWSPWLMEPTTTDSNETLRGSAMQCLGLASMSPPTSGFFGDAYIGGTHSPPTELRIAASHPRTGTIVVMEFPLWGEEEFGAMELGSPVRSVLSFSDVLLLRQPQRSSTLSTALDYESSRLCAQVEDDGRAVTVLWRKPGGMTVYSPSSIDDNMLRRPSFLADEVESHVELFHDLSSVPVPLLLPPLRPPDTKCFRADCIVSLKWWSDDSFGGPPLLVALTKLSHLLIFEIPPLWCIKEPIMPNFDTFNASSSGWGGDNDSRDGSNGQSHAPRKEYDVNVTPHPDFGLGLRLESPMDGLPAIAGSFKNHPLNGGMLPAEKTGVIALGDQLLSVNGVSLEKMTFDDIIATVRHVGADVGAGQPLSLKFRPGSRDALRGNSAVLHDSFSSRPSEFESNGDPEQQGSRSGARSHTRQRSDTGSIVSLEVGSYAESQQEFGRLVGVTKDVFSTAGDNISDRFLLLSLARDNLDRSWAQSLLLLAHDNILTLKKLKIPDASVADKPRVVDCGATALEGKGSNQIAYLKAIDSPVSGKKVIVAMDNLGTVNLITIDGHDGCYEAPVFEVCEICCHDNKSLPLQVRVASIGVLATMAKKVSNTGNNQIIHIWSPRPDVSSRLLKNDGAIVDNFAGNDYTSTDIVVDSYVDGCDEEVLHFCFFQTGFLDAFPSLAVFLESQLLVFQRRATSLHWQAVMRLSYCTIPNSELTSDILGATSMMPNASPIDVFPHILSSVRMILDSRDEFKATLSDWHPESLLAYLLTADKGPKESLENHIEKCFLWLSGLDTSRFSRISNASNVLLVTPFSEIGGESLLQEMGTVPHDSNKKEKPNIFAALQSTSQNSEPDKAANALATFSKKLENSGKQDGSPKSPEAPTGGSEVPQLLLSLSSFERKILCALLDIVVQPPDFGKLDIPGQHAKAIFSLHEAIKNQQKENTPISMQSSSSVRRSGIPSFLTLRQTPSSATEKHILPQESASAGCFAALLCNYQRHLLDLLRPAGGKLHWSVVREFWGPFWIRSDDVLRDVAEEVGQCSYRESRDILKAAVFFIAAGKLRTLCNLAAADSTETGTKFFKFLTGYDFSSERGRTAAEKNAFSLLRKNQYAAAAAFFLLSEPPALKSAVEIIATKMEDVNLAFMLARLVGNAQAAKLSGGVGFGAGAGGILGGGGGYAGAGYSSGSEVEKDQKPFDSWSPKITMIAGELLMDRVIPNAKEDPSLSAVCLLWLNRRDEAAHWMTGLIECPDGNVPRFSQDVAPTLFRNAQLSDHNRQNDEIAATNKFVNFVSGPILVKLLNARGRTRTGCSLVVATVLSRMGIELPALCVLTLNRNPLDEKESTRSTNCQTNHGNNAASTESSIFDVYETTTTTQTNGNGKTDVPSTSNMTSSIFDSFDVAPAAQPVSTPTMASSIFDSFDTAPGTKPVSQPQASIFDSFDPAPIQNKKASTKVSKLTPGVMTSSIFDGFDAPPTRAPPSKDPLNSKTASSIFDSFDPAPTATTSSNTTNPGQTTVSSPSRASMLFRIMDPPPVEENTPERNSPAFWSHWLEEQTINLAARRLVRELSTIGNNFHIDRFDPLLRPLGEGCAALVPSCAAQVLQFQCEGEELVENISHCVDAISMACSIAPGDLVAGALRILEAPYRYHRLCFAVLLHLSRRSVDLAEDMVRNAAHSLIERCAAFSTSNDDITSKRHTLSHVAGLYLRAEVSHLCWQLELCLWIHRGGGLPLSGYALNETICAVRIGLLMASWNRDFDCLETILRQPPDCKVNHDGGRQLWTSLKTISDDNSNVSSKKTGTTSGGWEFLVHCRRGEATSLLRQRQTGAFIIRPHPDDHGVFTLSFKTNLLPTEADTAPADGSKRSIKQDDVVQHAIVRLSDSGFRCGSFGPFATLMKLLEAVSSSLPFDLRFDLPPTQGVINEEGSLPSPNAPLFRKLGLRKADNVVHEAPGKMLQRERTSSVTSEDEHLEDEGTPARDELAAKMEDDAERKTRLSDFLELLVLSELRKQLSTVATAKYTISDWNSDDDESIESMSDESLENGSEREYASAARILRPLNTWCRLTEVRAATVMAPRLKDFSPRAALLPVAFKASETAIELSTTVASRGIGGGDALVRRMIQPESGVEFRTLRLGDGIESAMVVLFSKKEAVEWLVKSKVEKSREDAIARLSSMEGSRVIEPVDLSFLSPRTSRRRNSGGDETSKPKDFVGSGMRYRLVDPWEVEPLHSREAETSGAALGRDRFLAFSLGRVTSACQGVFRDLGGSELLELWAAAKGGVVLTKAIASVHPPWERDAGGDMQMENGASIEPMAFMNSIRQHLYRNALYRRLSLPQRFVGLIQVELLDLKNLTSPSGSLALTVFSVLRLKRPKSTGELNLKARTLDSVCTQPAKLRPVTGPNAPASWGSLVRFRFPLPEYTAADAKSLDGEREALFEGPPSCLQLAVYERKFMSDSYLGGADVSLDDLASGGQIEEWVPLSTKKKGINWFARIRLTLRFELICMASDEETTNKDSEQPASVGLRRIKQLSVSGVNQEELHHSISTPDLWSYFESV